MSRLGEWRPSRAIAECLRSACGHRAWRLEITRAHVLFCYGLLAGLVALRLGLPALHALVAFDWGKAGCCDAAVDWKAAQLAVEGLSPYEPPGSVRIGVAHLGFGHPPTAPFWFLPFVAFSHAELGLALALVALGVLALHVFYCVKELDFPAPLATSALVFVFLWSLSGIRLHLTVIQTSIPIAACCALSWSWLRRGNDVLGGAVLGVACTLKLFPGLLVLFLLLRRRFRAVTAAVLSWGTVFVVMAGHFGFRAWPQFLEQQEAIANKWIGSTRNASLHGVIRRAFTDSCGPPEVSETTLRILTTSASATLVIAAFVFITWQRRRRAPHEFDLSWSLLSVLAAFVNPWIWEHYATLLLLPALFVLRRLTEMLHRVWIDWLGGAVRGLVASSKVVVATAGLALLALAAHFQTQDWQARHLLVQDICQRELSPLVRAWSERKLGILETTHWCTWAVVIALVVIVGVLSVRSSPGGKAGIRTGEA